MFSNPWIWVAAISVEFFLALILTIVLRSNLVWAVFTLLFGIEALGMVIWAPTLVLKAAFVLVGLTNILGGLAMILKDKKPNK